MSVRTIALVAGALVLAAVVVVSAASAARGGGGGGPSTPTNLRITATTDTSISLAWDASRGSGDWWYCVQRPPAGCIRVNPPQTTLTLTRLAAEHDLHVCRLCHQLTRPALGEQQQRDLHDATGRHAAEPGADALHDRRLPEAHLGLLDPSVDNTSQVWYTLFLNGVPLQRRFDRAGVPDDLRSLACDHLRAQGAGPGRLQQHGREQRLVGHDARGHRPGCRRRHRRT